MYSSGIKASFSTNSLEQQYAGLGNLATSVALNGNKELRVLRGFFDYKELEKEEENRLE